MLNVGVSARGGWTVLHVRGEVDMATGPKLRQEMVSHIGEGRSHLIVDLAAVDFIDSTGLGVLIGGLKRARSQGGDLRVSGLHDRVQKIFDLTGLGDVLVEMDAENPTAPEAWVAP